MKESFNSSHPIDYPSKQKLKNEIAALWQRVYYTFLRATKDPELAEDLTQDTMFQAMESVDRGLYNPKKGSISTWVFNITRNCLINHYRSRNGKYSVLKAQDENTLSLIEHYAGNRKDLIALADDEEQKKYILRYIVEEVKKLKPIQKQLFNMRAQGMEYETIAEKLDMPKGTVKSALFRIRNRIKKKVKLHPWLYEECKYFLGR